MYNKPYNIHVLDHTRLFKKSMIQKNAQSPTTHPPKSSEKKKKSNAPKIGGLRILLEKLTHNGVLQLPRCLDRSGHGISRDWTDPNPWANVVKKNASIDL